jgi:hypothetical protein
LVRVFWWPCISVALWALFIFESFLVGFYCDGSCTGCGTGAYAGFIFAFFAVSVVFILGGTAVMRAHRIERLVGLLCILVGAADIAMLLIFYPSFLYYRLASGT